MNILKFLRSDKPRARVWEIRRTSWPYADGWGTYCPDTHVVLDTGLTKEEAERRCEELNDG